MLKKINLSAFLITLDAQLALIVIIKKNEKDSIDDAHATGSSDGNDCTVMFKGGNQDY